MTSDFFLGAAGVVVTGTVVTGSGPHSGDVPGTAQRATRLDLYIPDVARVHGTSAMVLLALVLATLLLVHRTQSPRPVVRRLEILLVVLVAQAGVGYTQYFTGIPALLVGIHVAGATALWAATVWFALGVTERTAYGIVTDLSDAGYVVKEKDGRRNRYQIQGHLPLRDPVGRERTIGEVLDLLSESPPRRASRRHRG